MPVCRNDNISAIERIASLQSELHDSKAEMRAADAAAAGGAAEVARVQSEPVTARLGGGGHMQRRLMWRRRSPACRARCMASRL